MAMIQRIKFNYRLAKVSYQFSFHSLTIAVVLGAGLTFLGACTPAKQTTAWVKKADSLYQSGQFNQFKNYTDSIRKSVSLNESETARIDSLQEISTRIQRDFCLTETDVKSRLLKYYPELNAQQLIDWEKGLKLEMRMINGEKRYFSNAVSNLFRLDDEALQQKNKVSGVEVDSLDLFCLEHTAKVVSATKTSGEPVLPVPMKLTYTMTAKANVVPEGKVIRCWMPFPREGHARQKNIKLLSASCENAVVATNDDLQRSVYMEAKAVKDQPTIFRIEFEVETAAQYFNLDPEKIKPYDTQSDLYKEFTSERLPQIVFTSQIKQLAQQILAGETNPLRKVQKIYNWINGSIRWASALEYSIMSDIPGYVLENKHGDCGMQTLLFMTLARSQGIPVKWQSGWMLHPRHVNLHDWCEVYYEGVGWVPLDQSFGLQKTQDEKVHNFYCSGIDAYRLIVNDDYSRKLTPSKKYLRSEPYDFQRGELEWEGGNLYFSQWNWHMDVEYK